MMFPKKLTDISITKEEVVLYFKKKEDIKIPFSEINKIYIKVNKVNPICVYLFLTSSFSAIILFIWVLGFDWVLLSPLFLIILGMVQLNKYKSYELKVGLKNGNFIIQSIPLKLKYKVIEAVGMVPSIYIENHLS